MKDYKELQYDDAKDAVREIYHSLMEMTEDYCERAENLNLDDEFIDSLRVKYVHVLNILKYNMIEIPVYTCNSLYNYCEQILKPFMQKNWREQQEKDYAAYLKKKGINESEDEQWNHIEEWCSEMKTGFYGAMSKICRGMFNTQLLEEGFIEKLQKFFFGSK